MPHVDSLARTEYRISARPWRPATPTLEAPPTSGLEAVPPSTQLVDGRYRVLGRLAQGGMGIIYRAEDVLLQRPAALKVVDPSLAHSAETLDLFRREARALARLRHDNVVQIYAFGSANDSYYFAMELVEGRNLDDILTDHLNARTSMSLDHVLELVQKVASGLTTAHARAICHRDIKPANIVIENETGRPVLVDFGIARHAKDTHHDKPSGTPAYMAPEQIRNEKGHDGARADLYSLACTTFELLCGAPPFEGGHVYELMFAHMETPPPLLSSRRPDYKALDGVFARALAKSPQYRQDSCVAFAQELILAAQTIARPQEIRELTLEIDFEDDELPASEPIPHARVVILAEEDGVRRSLVRESIRSLRKVGIENPQIDCVGNSSALYAKVQKHRPAVVVIDDDAAGGASVELSRTLRRLEGGDQMHIVVLTRHMLAERTVWQSINAKRLSKPLSARALASTLDDLVLTRP